MPFAGECFSDRSFPAAVVVFAGRCGRSQGGDAPFVVSEAKDA